MFFEILNTLGRGLRLRCPCCGHGHLFKTAFRTNEHFSTCEERFEREPGQRFGAVYLNLGLSVLLTTAGFVVTNLYTQMTITEQLRLLVPVAGVGPLIFFRVSTGLWTSIVFLGEGLYIQWPNR